MENYYAALNYTDTLKNDNDHIMVKIKLHGEKESVTISKKTPCVRSVGVAP